MSSLKTLRDRIEKLDTNIIQKLAKRQDLSKKIGHLKAKMNKEIKDVEREKQLMDNYGHLSLQYNLDPDFTKKLFKIIFAHSRKLQQNDE